MAQRAAVIGFGVTGESVVRHLLAQGIEAVVIDTRAPRPTQLAAEFLWETHSWPQLAVDYAVVSPGLAMTHCLVRGAAAAGIPLCSDIDLFFEAVQAPVIGVTGTNGKSTVTSLVGHLLNATGISCGVGGNLGTAALDVIDTRHQYYVLELSSFQLERSGRLPLQAAAVLNITEDHLDKHGDMGAYVAAKQRIYARAQHLVYNRDDAHTVPANLAHAVSFALDAPPGDRHWGLDRAVDDARVQLMQGGRAVLGAAEVPLVGAHNISNVLASCALVADQLTHVQMRSAVMSFTGLPHRFEKVRELAGVSYVNDSKATNLGATMAALAGLPATQQVVLIAGGDAKGVDLSPLADAMRGRVRLVVTIGQDGPRIGGIAQAAGIAHKACDSLEAAVRYSARQARPGDTVLLSPACASLDMFDNYMQRGVAFAAAVNELAPAAPGAAR